MDETWVILMKVFFNNSINSFTSRDVKIGQSAIGQSAKGKGQKEK